MRQIFSKKLGASLLELLIGTALIGVSVTALNLPIFRENLERGAQQYARQLSGSLRELYLTSVLQQTPCSILIGESAYTTNCKNRIPHTIQAPGNTRFIGGQLPTQIHLYPTGTTTPRTIRIRDQKKDCTVTLSLRGRTRERCL